MPDVRYRIACLFNCYCKLCAKMCACILCLTATHNTRWRYDPDYERCCLAYLDCSNPCTRKHSVSPHVSFSTATACSSWEKGFVTFIGHIYHDRGLWRGTSVVESTQIDKGRYWDRVQSITSDF